MFSKTLACWVTETSDDVQNARREASFVGEFAKVCNGNRRLLRRLEDHRVTSGQCGTELISRVRIAFVLNKVGQTLKQASSKDTFLQIVSDMYHKYHLKLTMR